MFAEFNKTQKFADQKGTVGFSGSKTTNGVTRLPGPHYILENANYGVMEQEKRTRAADAATADRWFRSTSQQQQQQEPQQPEESSYTPPETDFDSEYGPPGVPLLLAVARNSVGMDQPEPQPGEQSLPQQNMYDLEKNGTLLMQEKMWLSGGMAAADSSQGFLGAAGAPGAGGPGALPMLQMDPTDPTSMMFPPPPAPPPGQGQVGMGEMGAGQGPMPQGQHGGPQQQYIQTQTGIYMDGYGGQYATGTGAEQAAYMQQQFG